MSNGTYWPGQPNPNTPMPVKIVPPDHTPIWFTDNEGNHHRDHVARTWESMGTIAAGINCENATSVPHKLDVPEATGYYWTFR